MIIKLQINLGINLGQKKKKKLVSGNASEKKNLHPGGRKIIFLINFTEIFSRLL